MQESVEQGNGLIIGQKEPGKHEQASQDQCGSEGFTQDQSAQNDPDEGHQVDEYPGPGGADGFDSLIVPAKTQPCAENPQIRDGNPPLKGYACKIGNESLSERRDQKGGSAHDAGTGHGCKRCQRSHDPLADQGVSGPADHATQKSQFPLADFPVKQVQGVSPGNDHACPCQAEKDAYSFERCQSFTEEQAGKKGDGDGVEGDDQGGPSGLNRLQSKEEEHIIGENAGHPQEKNPKPLLFWDTGDPALDSQRHHGKDEGSQ